MVDCLQTGMDWTFSSKGPIYDLVTDMLARTFLSNYSNAVVLSFQDANTEPDTPSVFVAVLLFFLSFSFCFFFFHPIPVSATWAADIGLRSLLDGFLISLLSVQLLLHFIYS